jgi:hypothetical protein
LHNGGGHLNNACMSEVYGNKNAYPNTTLVLPKSGTQYYIFYCAVSDSICYQYFYDSLNIQDTFHFDEIRYTIVDMALNSGRGAVTSASNLLYTQHEYPWLHFSNFTATRHGNGRDWWLVKPSGQDRTSKYKFIVTASGVVQAPTSFFTDQLVTTAFGYDAVGQSTFSQDGTLYAECSVGSKISIYNFNRCSGEFTLQRIMEPSNLRSHVHPPVGADWTGLSFSPNGKFLYLSDFHHIYQIELAEPNDQVAFMDVSVEDTTDFPLYSSMQLTPTGHIWLGHASGTCEYINAIMQPNKKGLACDFRFDYAQLLSNTNEPPNLPYYGLGALAGSVCDSLTPKDTIKPWALYPNPASNTVYISLPATAQDILAGQQAQVFIYASNGTLVHKQVLGIPPNKILNLSVNHLAKALYFVQVVYKGERKIWKVVVE